MSRVRVAQSVRGLLKVAKRHCRQTRLRILKRRGEPPAAAAAPPFNLNLKLACQRGERT